ncbi:MAG: hypothetical protein M3312_02210 [Actinomycetota bacterium]|nr:hypothetical protein [Actinomycetota bacterium]
MKLAEQWTELVAALPRGWDMLSIDLAVESEERAERAVRVLGSGWPKRSGTTFRLCVDREGRRGVGASADLLRRVLRRLDAEGIRGRLELVHEADRAPEEAVATEVPLAAQWSGLLETVPPDWSHLYAEVVVDSTDYVERAALLMAPANPARFGGPRALRFRCARSLGYGVAVEMARRCLARLDADSITGRLHIVRVVSDARPVYTQGPVWHIGGRSV